MPNRKRISHELINDLYEEDSSRWVFYGGPEEEVLCCDSFIRSLSRAFRHRSFLTELILEDLSELSARILAPALLESKIRTLHLCRLSEEAVLILMRSLFANVKELMLVSLTEEAAQIVMTYLPLSQVHTLGLIDFSTESNRVVMSQLPEKISQVVFSNPSGVSMAGSMQALSNSRVRKITINNFSKQAIRIMVQTLKPNIRQIDVDSLSSKALHALGKELSKIKKKPQINLSRDFAVDERRNFSQLIRSHQLIGGSKRMHASRVNEGKRSRVEELEGQNNYYSEESYPNAQPSPNTCDLFPEYPSSQNQAAFFESKNGEQQEEEGVNVESEKGLSIGKG